MNVLVTGGAGFIGSNFVRYLLTNTKHRVVNYDCLTYAANIDYLNDLNNCSRYTFVLGNINNQKLVNIIIEKFEIDCIINFAAESHVDRSIADASTFIETNVVGTTCLLECARTCSIRFIQISTDEVYGSLSSGYAMEDAVLNPTSPYAASKAAADQFVLAYFKTYGVQTNIIRAANNYGPNQHKEKLIPLMLTYMKERKPLPVYGDGANQRDWLYVNDFCCAILLVLTKGVPGEIYNVTDHQEVTNLQMIDYLKQFSQHKFVVTEFVEDRLGHDQRYGMDNTKIKALGWQTEISLVDGLEKTVQWYKRETI
ncbi:dTDP-glucose 4,6-dehydratase [Enterococcus casseliflavus]|uniref:dTDP-glucose 4,6-dehydratase n=1 Tax=Enterococcus casseliflavus TaxID=37734 RepID=UPI003D0BB746